MRLPIKMLVVAAAIVAAAPPAQAADGVLIVETTTAGGTTRTNQIQIEKNRMRAESGGVEGQTQTFVFDGTKQVMWIINNDKKTYSEMTKADADRLGGQVSDATAKMQAQLQNLPPEQRARIEAMMAGRGAAMGAGAAAKTEYRKTGADKVGKWACDVYEGTRDGQKVAEVCTVDPQVLGFTSADFEVSRQLQAFFAKLVPQGAESLFRIGSAEAQGFSGVPVRRVSFGARPSTTEITNVSRQNFSDATFAVPEGFQKQASPFGGRGRGGR